ncbi:hypothetical protein [Bradyrhizobium canariense]|uniref:hypothetical protein n=1 Tax=Bradyrhizobium canariense TaxID=255045 RepID=UPI001431EFAB|nr:hypothetical protein [Bradyrhizobium canariense]
MGETAEPVSKPSGEVAPMAGVGLAIPPTCAMATLQTTSAGRTAAINANRLPAALPQRAPMSISFATIPLGARLLDIGQSLRRAHRASEWSATADVQLLVQRDQSWSSRTVRRKLICSELVCGLLHKLAGSRELFN